MLGCALLTGAMSWIDGLFGGMLDTAAHNIGNVRVVDPGYAQREQLMPLEHNIPTTAPLEEALRKVPGVEHVYPRIQTGVTATVGEEIGERFGLVQGAPLDFFTHELQLDTHLAEGRMLASDDEVVVGKTLVGQIGAKLGDDVVFLGQTQDGSMSPVKLELVGIADLGSTMQNRQIFVTLEKARWLADIPDGATEVLVFGGTRADAPAIAARIRSTPEASKLDVKAWSERKPWTEILGLVGTIKGIATGVIVFITALGVFNTMLMSVLERTAEIGVLRAMGLRRFEVIILFVTEALGIASVGGVVGAAIGGSVAYLWLERRGVDLGTAIDRLPATIPINSTVHAHVTPNALLTAFALGLVMAVLGGWIPAWRASRIEPVDAMRSRH
jgi:putative ABC transport system permease protein